ncbi:MAG: hypothetical protein ACPGWR_29440 [Ardenticatenaceae bacterium]
MSHTTPSQAAPPHSVPNQAKPPRGKSARWIFRKLLGWFIFTLIFSLLPISLNWLSGVSRDQVLTMVNLISHGELLIISVAITAAATGEIITNDPKKFPELKIISIGTSMAILVIASWWYSDITTALRLGEEINLAITSRYSLSIFFLAALTSGINVALSEL